MMQPEQGIESSDCWITHVPTLASTENMHGVVNVFHASPDFRIGCIGIRSRWEECIVAHRPISLVRRKLVRKPLGQISWLRWHIRDECTTRSPLCIAKVLSFVFQ